jgi:hypothetical protein
LEHKVLLNKTRGHEKTPKNPGDIAFLKMTSSNDGEKVYVPSVRRRTRNRSPNAHVALVVMPDAIRLDSVKKPAEANERSIHRQGDWRSVAIPAPEGGGGRELLSIRSGC